MTQIQQNDKKAEQLTTRIPVATYRLQFNAQFRFSDATRMVAYLDALGVTDVYASPIFKARKGSTHGYDVTDHTHLNPELGRAADFEHFSAALQSREMGLILDVVPNHMGVADDSNSYWHDVLENGPSSPFASFFDIDWLPPKTDLHHKVLLPILGDQYGRALENAELRLAYRRGAFWIRIYERRLPAAPRTWSAILEPLLERLRNEHDENDPDFVELESILTSLGHLPPRTETDPEKVQERRREKEVIKRRLATLLDGNRDFRKELDRVVAQINGQRGDSRSFDPLEELLAQQAYRLSYWRVASDEINYRRFFDINDLAAIRVERLEVFKIVHNLIFRLIRSGHVTGLRIDHPDGLHDPEQYFRDLQEGCRQARMRRLKANRLQGHSGKYCFVVAEKILTGDEALDPNWAIHGTTGYEFLNCVNGIFVERENAVAFRDLYEDFTANAASFEDLLYECKKLILEASMSGELRVLSRRLDRISEQHRWSRDFTLPSLRNALREVIACFPVYRTYTRVDSQSVSEETRRNVTLAVRMAKRRNPIMNESLFDFIAAVLLLEDPEQIHEAQRAERRDFVMSFQQITAPVIAKGFEDTTFYRRFPLASLNEVGGEPESFGVSVDEFHRRNAERLGNWPHSLCATSTHDTKRSEDVRARINVLSEIPKEWAKTIRRWSKWNKRKKIVLDGSEVPDRNEEYLLYQSLVGTWPLAGAMENLPGFTARMQEYLVKAIKEAKLHTSWLNPNAAYEAAVGDFVEGILSPLAENAFLSDLERFVGSLARAGAVNSLSQTLLKMTVPGTPDFYQGCELWDWSLVDPDNRRPVDFKRQAQILSELKKEEAAGVETLAQRLCATWSDGRIKMYVTYKTLHQRKDWREVFLSGDYLPLECQGSRKAHICAFARSLGKAWVIVVVPRMTAKLGGLDGFPVGETVWGDTVLQLPRQVPDAWQEVFSGRRVQIRRDAWTTVLPLAEILQALPVALLIGRTPED